MRVLVGLLLCAGCAMHESAAALSSGALSVDVEGIPDGMFQALWRVRSQVEDELRQVLAERRRPDDAGWTARFRLLETHYYRPPDAIGRVANISITYRFTLTDAHGRVVVELAEQLMLDGDRLFRPRERVYFLMRRAVARIADAVDEARRARG